MEGRENNLATEQHRLMIESYFQIAEGNNIHLIPNPEIDRLVSDVQGLSERCPKGSIPYRLGEEYRLPGAFYSKLIRPYLPDTRDAFRPNDDDIRQFCEGLRAGVNIVLYYAFSKTSSPGRTGSPDWKVDFAEFEMLKNYFLLTEVARQLGLNLGIIIVDETPILQEQEELGIKKDDISFNQQVFELYRSLSGGRLIYRPIDESVGGPLGVDFDQFYNKIYPSIIIQIEDDIRSRRLTPEIIRMGVFIDILPLSTLEKYNLNPDQARQFYESLKSGDFGILDSLPSDLVTKLISLTAHTKSIMELRKEAGQRVREERLTSLYPEYGDTIYGGVTRSAKRWSFLPLPTRWNGRTVNPMHGLAVYKEDGDFMGVCPKRELPANAEIIYYPNSDKPLFAKI